jgi:uncharacterized membrane protein HdeD (DUF308 family)
MAIIAVVETWWTLVLRGFAALLFGVLTFVWPGISVAALVLLFGAYALVDGVFHLINAFTGTNEPGSRWATVFQGLAGIGVGLLTLLWPGLTLLALIALVAAWALLKGAFEIVAAIRLRKVLTNEWLMVLSGILSMVFGVALIAFPLAGLVGLIWVIGFYAILIGALMLMLGFKLRRLERHPQEPFIPHPA